MYFSKFPLVDYIYKTNEGKVVRKKLATNILKRVGFTSLSKKDKDHFISYQVKDGETPEIIADKLYDNPEHHWLVLLFNDIVHPLRDWPMDNLSLDNYVENKYKGVSLFLTNDTTPEPGHPGTINFHTDQTVADTSGTYDAYGVLVLNANRARVIEWDPTYSRLVLDSTSSFNEGEIIVGVGATGQEVKAKIQRSVPNTVAVHHFERRNGGISGDIVELNPLGSVESDGQIPLGATGVSFDGGGATTAPNNHDLNSVVFGETLIGRYMGICGSNNNNNVITNMVQEVRLNDEKREIKLLHPDYISLAVQELNELINVKGLIT